MKLILIAAISENYAIGKNGTIPWHISNDLKMFKSTTLNNTIIMGRKTLESIGKPLPKRYNIVLSSNDNYLASIRNKYNLPIITENSLEAAITTSKNKFPDATIFIIGGERLFKESIDIADELYITKVKTTVLEADAFFPKINPNIWTLTSKTTLKADDNNDYDHSFCRYSRK